MAGDRRPLLYTSNNNDENNDDENNNKINTASLRPPTFPLQLKRPFMDYPCAHISFALQGNPAERG